MLPESYTNLIHVTLLNEDVIISPVECTLTVNLSNLLWQTAAHRLVNEEVQSVDDPIGWAAFHANAQQPHDFDVTITSLLPLFPDDSKYVAAIRHLMDFDFIGDISIKKRTEVFLLLLNIKILIIFCLKNTPFFLTFQIFWGENIYIMF